MCPLTSNGVLRIIIQTKKTWNHYLWLIDILCRVDSVAAVGGRFTLFMFARVAIDAESLVASVFCHFVIFLIFFFVL